MTLRQNFPDERLASDLEKKQLFEELFLVVQQKGEADLQKRRMTNILPTEIELSLGCFVEGLDLQTREAVLLLHKKGYCIDASGFTENPCIQMIEGDFQLSKELIEKLSKIDVQVMKNASDYTRIQFTPESPDINDIKKKWILIASLFPEKSCIATPSMTQKARNFRLQNTSPSTKNFKS